MDKIFMFNRKSQNISAVTGITIAALAVSAQILGLFDRLGDSVLALSLSHSIQVMAFVLPILTTVAIISYVLFFLPIYNLERQLGVSKLPLEVASRVFLGRMMFLIGAGIVGVEIALWLYAHYRSTWWLWLGLICAIALAAHSRWIPTRTMVPLEDEALLSRLRKLANQAGLSISGYWVLKFSRATLRGNAYAMGWGRAKRIAITDTLLHSLERDEIEAVIAHEMGHYAKEDVARLLLISGAGALATLYLGDRLLVWTSSNPHGLTLNNLANLPIAAMWFYCAWFLTRPITNLLRRWRESAADRFAVQLTKNKTAYISLLRKLDAQNLLDSTPPLLYELFFMRHPATKRRIINVERVMP